MKSKYIRKYYLRKKSSGNKYSEFYKEWQVNMLISKTLTVYIIVPYDHPHDKKYAVRNLNSPEYWTKNVTYNVYVAKI